MWELSQKTDFIEGKIIDAGYRVVSIWEHEFSRMKMIDRDLQSFLEGHDVIPRLNPRDSFFGGRTNAVKLFSEGNIKYVDFTSLYPWVNKYCR